MRSGYEPCIGLADELAVAVVQVGEELERIGQARVGEGGEEQGCARPA